MINWILKLFKFRTHKKHTFLTKGEVRAIEHILLSDKVDLDTIRIRYGISRTTLNRIIKGEHRFSSRT